MPKQPEPEQPSGSAPQTAALRLGVDRTSPVPLYFQLSQQLEAAIEKGRLSPGSLLGNEIELAARLGLSRPTVRQAIQSLVDKGLLVRRRGVGTQVLHSKVRRPLELSSLYDDLEAAGQRPTTRVLRNTVEPATARIAAALGVAEGADVRLVERLRYAHDEPMARLRNHLPVELLDCDTAQLESTGLYRMMRAVGITLHSARQSVGARAADAEEARLLGEAPGAPLLAMERTTFDDTGRAVEFGDHIYRASRYAFEFQLLVRP
ncbi:GntR family transcriptional regulator [Streptomyces niveus]|uniref:GntR family transcriptional regulator n=1 Tax=Streptomyces niveus TaxID=193462 RepID=UPI00343938C0